MNDFNPLQFKGKEWFTIRDFGDVKHVDAWREIDRNKTGRVTVVAQCFWGNNMGTCMDKNATELLTATQVEYMTRNNAT